MRRIAAAFLAFLLYLPAPAAAQFGGGFLPAYAKISGGTGTTNVLPKWDATGNTLADSSLSDDGTNVTLASGAIKLPDYSGSGAASLRGTTNATGGLGITSGGLVDVAFTDGVVYLRLLDLSGFLQLQSSSALTWSSGAVGAATDTIVARAAAATPYFYGSSTAVGATLRLGNTNVGYEDFARNSEAHTLAAAGTSTTATAVWPAGSGSQAAAFRITTEITGCTSVQVGVAGDVTRYGTFSTLTAGQTIAIGRIDNYAAATGVLFTCVGGGASFTAGVVRVNLRYITASASTS